MVLTYLIAKQYLNYVVPKFESTAKIRLADMGEGVPNSNLFKDLDVFATSQKLNAEIEIIKSDLILGKALSKLPFQTVLSRVGEIKKQELYEDAPIKVDILELDSNNLNKEYQFNVLNTSEGEFIINELEAYKFNLGDTVVYDNNKLCISLDSAFLQRKSYIQVVDKYEFVQLSRESLIARVKNNLDVSLIDKDVPVVRISYTSPHAVKAMDFPNVLAETYIEDYIQTKFEAANTTVEFLQDRINETSQKLSNSENDILRYRQKNSITNIRQETETDLRKLAQLKIQFTNINMSLEAIEELEKYIESGQENFLDLAPNFEAFTDLLSTEMIKNIKALQAEKKDLLLSYTAKDEKVKVVDAKIKDLTSYLTESIKNTRKNLAVKRNKLEEDIAIEEQKFISIPEKERSMTVLNREFENIQRSYNFLTQKKIEAEIAKAAKIAFHRVIAKAKVEKKPVSPNKGIIKIVATILGMFGAILLILVVHIFKAKVNDISGLEKNTDIPVEAFIRKHKTQREKQKYFRELVAKWEVKKILNTQEIVVVNSFKLSHGARYLVEGLISRLIQQDKKLLLVNFSEVETVALECDQLNFSKEEINALSTQELTKHLQELAADYDHCFLLNANLYDEFAYSVMAAGDVNVFAVDCRLTPMKKIEELNVIDDEYDFKKNLIALNRYKYNPSVIKEAWNVFTNIIHFIKALRNEKFKR